AMIRECLSAIADQIVVGHNIPFDLRFLDERARRLDVAMPAVGFIDTLGLARQALEDPDEELTLEYVAECLELEIPEQLHRAVPDARLAEDVFWALVERQQFETLADARVRRFESHDH
ncbi:MAG: exonuclease domain-containing protein, partial [Persicimonas sp.]